MTSPRGVERTPAQFAIIRMSLLGGALLFGAVIWFLHRQPGYVPDGSMERLRPVFPTIILGFIAGIVAIRVYLSRVRDPNQIGTWQLIGWALGESAALLGGVYYFNTDDPRFYVLGIFVMVASFIVLPLRRT